MDNFPGNSHRPIAPTENNTKITTEVKLEPVVSGPVIRRKPPLGRRLMKTLFDGDTGVVHYLLNEVLVPALKDTATTMVQQGIEKAVYGEVRSQGRPVRGGVSPASRTMVDYGTQRTGMRPPAGPAARRFNSTPQQILDDLILPTKFDADNVANKMYETVQQYGTVSLANLYELMGMTSLYTDNKFGWTDLDRMDVRPVRGGYLIVMPPLEDL